LIKGFLDFPGGVQKSPQLPFSKGEEECPTLAGVVASDVPHFESVAHLFSVYYFPFELGKEEFLLLEYC
jgi:hypothetical protein